MAPKRNVEFTNQLISEYLLRGYQLNICYSKETNRCFGAVVLYKHPLNIQDLLEIDIDCLLSKDSKIKEYLKNKYRHFGCVTYNFQTGEFIGKIIKEVTEGPYCEEKSLVDVEDTTYNSQTLGNLINQMDTNLSPPQNKVLSKK